MSCNRHYLNLHLRQFFPASVISTILHVLNSSPSYSYRSYQNLSSAGKVEPQLYSGGIFSLWKLFVVHLEFWEREIQKNLVRFFSLHFPPCMSLSARFVQVLFISGVCLLSSSILEVIKMEASQLKQAKQVLHLLQNTHKNPNKQTNWGVRLVYINNLTQY